MTSNYLRPVIICGGDYARLQERGDCPNSLHDWPLPDGYNEAEEVARSRISQGWTQKRCPDCELYGWTNPPKPMRGLAANPTHVPHDPEGK